VRTVLLISLDRVGATMSGPGIRYYHLAAELAREHEVTLVAPGAGDARIPNVETISLADAPAARARQFAGYDAVITRPLPVETARRFARRGVRLVFDLYVPVLSEQLAALTVQPEHHAAVTFHRLAMLDVRRALLTGDAFACASERQRDFWLGMLAMLGRLDLDRDAEDPTLRSLIDVVPFGVEQDPPRADAPALKGVVPGIAPDDSVLLWGGGVWNWLDPITPIRAVAELSRRRDDVKLVFMALRHPDVVLATAAERAVELARSLGVLDKHVFFNERWVDYAGRSALLSEADIGVSAHYDTLETHYSYRARLFDYFWARVPIVTTRGDVLGDLIEERGLGRVLAPGDVHGWVAAIEELLDGVEERRRVAVAYAALRAELSWANAAAPLRRLVQGEPAGRRPLLASGVLEAESLALRAEAAYAIGGVRGMVSRQLAKVAGSVRR
jgi:glycosyltransferase involved in cell wall biosynthesis